MNDPWMTRLSEYIDGELSADEARELETHLEECDACAAAIADIRAVLAAATSLEDEAPVRDLWAGIAAGIEAHAATADVTPLHPQRLSPRQVRRFSFSMPQLAAAALVLMSVTAGGMWLLARPAGVTQLAPGTIVHSSGAEGAARFAETPIATPAGADTALTRDVAALEQALAENRQQLDPATVEVIERSMATIDRAIGDARAALEADPGNPRLHRQLDSTMRKKLDLLERATRRVGT